MKKEENKTAQAAESKPELKPFEELVKDVAALPRAQQQTVALFTQGVIAATAAGVKHE